MEMLPGSPLNVDITKFMGQDLVTYTEIVLNLIEEGNELLLLRMLERGFHSDIILTAQGGSVKAHGCVLSAASSVFRAMYEYDMREKLSSTVNIPDITIEALQLFLLVIYTIDERVRRQSQDQTLPWIFRGRIDKHLDELLKAFLKYQVFMRRLDPLLVDALKRNLTADNCWGYYDISLQFIDKSISSTVRQYIISNFHKVVQSAEFLLEMRRDPDRVYIILIEADQASHMMIKKLSAAKHGQSSKKRARQV